jgi:hypothetical protein
MATEKGGGPAAPESDHVNDPTSVQQQFQAEATRATAAASKSQEQQLEADHVEDGPTRPVGNPGKSVGWTDRGDMVSHQNSAWANIKAHHAQRPTIPNEHEHVAPEVPTETRDRSEEDAPTPRTRTVRDIERDLAEHEITSRGELTEAQQARVERMLGELYRETGREVTQRGDPPNNFRSPERGE